ncbi:MAG: leucine-rich repeat protein [Clostridia bacterium]|nr:leucine-rich repeat protein [Clostridia bacterium]
MRKKIRKRNIKKIAFLFTTILFLIVLGVTLNNNLNKTVKSEYDIKLESETKQLKTKVIEMGQLAFKSGKKTDEEIQGFILERLKSENVYTDNHYITVIDGKTNVVLKHKAFIVGAGYYKAGSNFNELIESWKTLNNTRLANVVDGKLGYLKYSGKEKLDVIIDNSIVEIKDKVFNENVKIDTLYIPESVKIISNKAFNNINFDEVIFNANVDTLYDIFKNNATLNKFTFTKKIKFIKDEAFKNTNIKEINFLGTIEDLISTVYFSYYDAPNNNSECKLYIYGSLIDEIKIPDDTKKINEYIFMNYTNITKVKLPDTIEEIGRAAFMGGSIRTIEYEGTKEMWEKIKKAEEWYTGEIECTIYCKDGEIIYKKENR